MMNHEDITISFVIPAFNEAARIDHCLASIIGQNKNNNIEIVLIDDGSADNTYEIMREYELRYPFVSAVHLEENAGLSHARNVGLEHAAGKYIWFVDADDYIDKNAVEELSDVVETSKEALDCVFFFWYRVMDDYIHPTPQQDELKHISEQKCFSGRELFREMARCTERFVDGVCRCIISRKFIEQYQLRFVEGSTYEDGMFGINIFMKAQHVRCINKAYYYYNNNTQSWTHRMSTEFNYACAFVELVYYCKIGMRDIIDEEFREIYAKFLNRYVIDAEIIRKKLLPEDDPLRVIKKIDADAAMIYEMIFGDNKAADKNKKVRELLASEAEGQVIIYGAGQKARNLAELLDNLNKQILCYVVSDEFSHEKYPQNPKYIYGVPVKTLSELGSVPSQTPVLVTVRGVHQSHVRDMLLEKGMEKVIIIDI